MDVDDLIVILVILVLRFHMFMIIDSNTEDIDFDYNELHSPPPYTCLPRQYGSPYSCASIAEVESLEFCFCKKFWVIMVVYIVDLPKTDVSSVFPVPVSTKRFCL